MEFSSARQAILQLLRTVAPADLPALLEWMRTSRDFDEFTHDNNDSMLKSIAEDLRNLLPLETMLSSEHLALQKIQQQPEPTVHVDAFLYDEDVIDSLCEEGKMSRNYCVVCGSYQTAPLGQYSRFISHSFSLVELKFIYHHVLPDLSGKLLVDVGSRLGSVLYGVKSSLRTYSAFGKYFPANNSFACHHPSSALQLYGVELNGDFCQLQEMIIKKYQFTDRIKVLHADICTQDSLLQNADVVIMNNVFEYFLDEAEQARAWECISHNVRKQGSLLVTVPSLEESLSGLQVSIQLSSWVEEIPLNYNVYPEKDTNREAFEQIHLYKIL
ncbi:uncharacterized protein LOC118726663 isoform X1 [Pipistrellus kuhlii]|uniref:uncharacterized protein LOC118726663 isoform X1 n=1 Tax=Pipistrellus kuhlii TaxID=59472 RepID=UPI00174F4D87|nr:uncharacterized protein LOC118726663 isoform X1 [Pipistrellus kuhlii]